MTVAKEGRTHPAHWDQFLDKEFAKESERASVILGAALLDDALDEVLRARLTAPAAKDDSLFDGANAPIGRFSARIDLAHRLGLIAADMARALHLIRRIRNDFAHNVTSRALSDPETASRLRELNALSKLPERYTVTRRQYPDGPKGDFQMTVGFYQFQLRSLAADVVRLDQKRAVRGEAILIDHDR